MRPILQVLWLCPRTPIFPVVLTAALLTVATARGQAEHGGTAPHEPTWNLQVVIAEELANRVVSERRTDAGEVRDCILGADVYGRQTTRTTVRLDFLPSAGTAHFEFVLEGLVCSDTIGVSGPVAVQTLGEHRFLAKKPVFFNGRELATRRATIAVLPNNCNVGAATPLDGVPLLGPLAGQFVLSQAESRRSMSEAVTAERLSERLLPEFNNSIDAELTTGNRWLFLLHNRLEQLQLAPRASDWSSTDTRVSFRGKLGPSADSVTPVAMPSDSPLVIAVHESLLNHLADRLDLGGTALNSEEAADLPGKLLARLLNRVEHEEAPPNSDDDPANDDDDNAPAPAFVPPSLVLDSTEPVRFRVDDGWLTVTLRAALKMQNQPALPTQVITIPVRLAPRDELLVLESGDVNVTAAEPQAQGSLLFLENVLRGLIKAAIPTVEIQRSHSIPIEGRGELTLRIKDVTAADGWLVLSAE